jgi:hypothetical protein
MATFVEVNDIDKRIPVIINMDNVIHIEPMIGQQQGTLIWFSNGKLQKVSEKYDMFKQLAIQTVSAEDIARVNGRTAKVVKEKAPVGDLSIPKFGE